MPFITEEIWQRIAPLAGAQGKTIMLQPWPVANEARIDEAAESDIEWLKTLMLGTRNIRAEMNIGPGKPLAVFVKNASAEDQRRQLLEQRIAPLAGAQGKTIMLQPWPVANEARIDQAAEDDIEWLKALAGLGGCWP